MGRVLHGGDGQSVDVDALAEGACANPDEVRPLHGRDQQRAAITALIDRARAGSGGALVLRGEPGSGKTSLLNAPRTARSPRGCS